MKTSDASCTFLAVLLEKISETKSNTRTRRTCCAQSKKLSIGTALMVLHSINGVFARGPIIVRVPMDGALPSPCRIDWRAATPMVAWVSGDRAHFRFFLRNG